MPSCLGSRNWIASRKRLWMSGPRSIAAASVICHSTCRREPPDCKTFERVASSAAAVESSCLVGLHGIRRNARCFWTSQLWFLSQAAALVSSLPPSRRPLSRTARTRRTRIAEASRAGISPSSIRRRRAATAAWYSELSRGTHQPSVSSPPSTTNSPCFFTMWSTTPTRTKSAAFCSTPCVRSARQCSATNGQRSQSARSAPLPCAISAILPREAQKVWYGSGPESRTEVSKTHLAALSQTAGCIAFARVLLTVTKMPGRSTSSLPVFPTSSPKMHASLASAPSAHWSRALETNTLPTLLHVSPSGERVFAQTLCSALRCWSFSSQKLTGNSLSMNRALTTWHLTPSFSLFSLPTRKGRKSSKAAEGSASFWARRIISL
mmetsp:Transcript_67686/g.209265  ORF Transcript_67686/g.209265 Transcript_67686/m.209265 type:complete len:379 (+) Transcript_67686:2942-4078(+)